MGPRVYIWNCTVCDKIIRQLQFDQSIKKDMNEKTVSTSPDFPSIWVEEESSFPSLLEALLFFFFSAWTYSCRLQNIKNKIN